MTPRGDIRDIKHVVILMPENRSFDHYFGSLRGVRGFGDRATILLPGDLPAWQQPDTAPGQPTTGSAEHCTDSDRDTGGWYDLHVTIDSDSAWSQRFTGHLETGAPSVTG